MSLRTKLYRESLEHSQVRESRKNRESSKVFAEGQREQKRPLASFGDTGIAVRTMRKGGKKYQEPRRDRLQRMSRNPDGNVQAPRLMTGLHWFNDPREVWRD